MTNQPRSSGPDLIGEFQRWLLRSSARGMSRELGDQIKSAFRGSAGGAAGGGDVWETATAEPPADQAPECAWCPVCRAARLLKVSGPGLASQMAAAGDAFGHLLADAMAVADATLAAAGRAADEAKKTQAQTGSAAVRVVEVEVEDAAPEGRPRGADGAQAPASLEGLPGEPDDRG